ncbi:hypothetical protein DM01DRAFT_1339084 [Hesseltinella vesiculosa]|uniref:Uncharacterized protein n=1 Tax=Hesseltinella vesiculosa TaxID=101127 RepID=A0A1X2G844_9FUNG|nr:hypothetical protein DM01DRAFT_1339084 [Hesseltinella vesiculosa]
MVTTFSLYSLLHAPPVIDDQDDRLKDVMTFLASQDQAWVDQLNQQLMQELQCQHLTPQSLKIIFCAFLPLKKTEVMKTALMQYFLQEDQANWGLPFLYQHWQQLDDEMKRALLEHGKSRSQYAYHDLQYHQFLCHLQDDLQPTSVWREEFLVNCQDKQIEMLITRWILQPSLHNTHLQQWEKLFPMNQGLPPSVQNRLKLHLAIHPIELALFVQAMKNHGVCLQPVTDECLDLIQTIKQYPAVLQTRVAIAHHSHSVLHTLSSSEWEPDHSLLHALDTLHHEGKDAVFLELLSLLKYSSTRYLSLLTLSLISVSSDVSKEKAMERWTQAMAVQLEALTTIPPSDIHHQQINQFIQWITHFRLYCQRTHLTADLNEWGRLWQHFTQHRVNYIRSLSLPTIHDPLSRLVESLFSSCHQTKAN